MPNPLAIVTGASSGIGYHLADIAAQNGYDLIVCADEPKIGEAAADFRKHGIEAEAVQADLATLAGVDKLYAALRGRPVDALMANAGRGLGHGFLDQDFGEVRRVIDTNVTGTLYLIQKIGRDMRSRDAGRILITGSVAGFLPGSFQAVYNGTKAFIDSFAFALRDELKDTKITISLLMPGPTDTAFFDTADLLDTKMGAGPKDDAAAVAQAGFDAMISGEADVVYGLKNKLQTAMATVTPNTLLAGMHRSMAEPGSAKQ
jgi:short-subunit dehydrogenase